MRAALLSLVALGCGAPSPALEGSLTELVALEYDRVEVTRSQDGVELSVAFLRQQATRRDLVLKVTARSSLTGQDVPIQLGPDAQGVPVGAVHRDVEGDPRREFPAVERGELSLDDNVLPGTRLGGEVRVTFANGTHAAAGRTVFGRFEGQVP